jgi:hypothetical protein
MKNFYSVEETAEKIGVTRVELLNECHRIDDITFGLGRKALGISKGSWHILDDDDTFLDIKFHKKLINVAIHNLKPTSNYFIV